MKPGLCADIVSLFQLETVFYNSFQNISYVYFNFTSMKILLVFFFLIYSVSS